MTEKTEITEPVETTVPQDDPVAVFILDQVADGKSYTFKDLAMCIFNQRKRPKDRPDGWRRFMTAVKQQSIHLARQGRLEIVRKGQVVDPKNFKGIVRVRKVTGGTDAKGAEAHV